MSASGYSAVDLPMYDWPEVRAATASLEAHLQKALLDALDPAGTMSEVAPASADLEANWLHPGLLLSQTCGYPLTQALRDRVALLGVPHYRADGCEGPYYCSQIIVRKSTAHARLEDLRGAVAVLNSTDSQSGMSAFRRAVAGVANGARFFNQVTVSGSHLASMECVALGLADVGCIDTVSWWLAGRELPELAGNLRSIGRSQSAPGLPLITSRAHSAAERERMVAAVEEVFTDPETQESRERLGIRGFTRLSLDAYDVIVRMEQEASDLGYPELV